MVEWSFEQWGPSVLVLESKANNVLAWWGSNYVVICEVSLIAPPFSIRFQMLLLKFICVSIEGSNVFVCNLLSMFFSFFLYTLSHCLLHFVFLVVWVTLKDTSFFTYSSFSGWDHVLGALWSQEFPCLSLLNSFKLVGSIVQAKPELKNNLWNLSLHI